MVVVVVGAVVVGAGGCLSSTCQRVRIGWADAAIRRVSPPVWSPGRPPRVPPRSLIQASASSGLPPGP